MSELPEKCCGRKEFAEQLDNLVRSLDVPYLGKIDNDVARLADQCRREMLDEVKAILLPHITPIALGTTCPCFTPKETP